MKNVVSQNAIPTRWRLFFTLATSIQPTGTRTTDVGTNLIVGNRSAANVTWDGFLDEVTCIDRTIGTANVLDYNNKQTQLITGRLRDTVSFYPMSGDSQDLVGNNPGVDTSVSYVNDRHGVSSSAAQYNGTTSKTTLAASTSIENIWDGGGTFIWWMNPNSDGETSAGSVFHKGIWTITVISESGGFMRLRFIHNFTGSDGDWRTAVIIPINTWTHCAVVYNSGSISNKPVLYVNGFSVTLDIDTNPDGGTRDSDVGFDLVIGNRANQATTFDGEIDNVHIVGRIVSAAEARQIYAGESVVAWMSMDNTTWGDRFTQRQKVI